MWDKYPFLKDELDAFETYLSNKFSQKNKFLHHVSHDLISSGGKRLRPTLVILCGMIKDYSREKIFPLAGAIETLHTATLIHDDIIDNAKIRRNQPTVSDKHGTNIAVYTGDYLLASAFLMLSESGLQTDKLEYVAKAARAICTGEVNQYLNRYQLTSVSSYLRRTMKKTGILFSASCILGAFAAGCSDREIKTLGRFGLNLGVAFQIRDDLNDIECNEAAIGKPVANDLKEGIATLPFLLAAKHSKKIKQRLEDYFAGNQDEIKEIIQEVLEVGGNDESKVLKNLYIDKCRKLLNTLPKYPSLAVMEEILNQL